MNDFHNAAREFLTLKNLAVAGASRKGDTAANIIYRKLKKSGYQLFPVHPYAETIEGDKAYSSISDIPEKVDGLVIGTPPDATSELIKQCAQAGISYVWVHRSIGQGSFHPDCIQLAKQLQINLIPGGCPMMFLEPVDLGHKCLRWYIGKSKKETRPVGFNEM